MQNFRFLLASGDDTSVGRALGSHYAKYATRITLLYQGKIAIIGVHKEIQMSIYPGKGGNMFTVQCG